MSNNFLSSTPQDLQKSLDDMNRKLKEEETQSQASHLHLPYVDLKGFPVDLNILGLFTADEAKQAGAVPFFKEQSDLRIGVTDPTNPLLLQKVQEFSVKNKVTLYFISQSSLAQAMVFYGKIIRPRAATEETVRVDKELNFAEILKQLADPALQVKKNATEFLDLIFGASMSYGASDIHIEPEQNFLKLRFRIDGVLQDMLHIDKSLQRQIVTRLKVIAKLKLNIENVPQDGRITFYYLKNPIDVRVSILPSAYGEELVLRLLGTGAVNLQLKDLGFREQTHAVVERALAKPNGMMITTGPTGSGKTTTLYAFINELNDPGVKIITLEDPVEYKLEGVVQTPIDHNVDFDFAKGLRAILRQDPDIVMVGEIRDQETAETAMQAALTGHMVLSTLHTNDAAGAIPRLINMGVKPFIIGPAITCVIAQRLVRKICEFCKQPAALSASMLEKINLLMGNLPKAAEVKWPNKPQFFHSTGCPKCNGLGYKGRIGIYEVLEVNEGIQSLIMKQAPMSDFRKAGIEQGMITMGQDGLLKALDGVTDVEEVFRVAGE